MRALRGLCLLWSVTALGCQSVIVPEGHGGSGGNSSTSGSSSSSSSGGTTCVPVTCSEAGVGCGPLQDGCGGLLDCGSCPQCSTCGGGGVPGLCGGQACCPLTCGQLGLTCGISSDGCGLVLDCGTCAPGESCILGGCAPIPATCTTTADCSEGSYCAFVSGYTSCFSKCDGSMCQGLNTCVSDADCAPGARCVCSPSGCTMCIAPL